MNKQEIADKYTGEDVTLDGQPAVVLGRLLPFGHVRNPRTGQSAEYAWETIQHVIETKGGAFKS